MTGYQYLPSIKSRTLFSISAPPITVREKWHGANVMTAFKAVWGRGEENLTELMSHSVLYHLRTHAEKGAKREREITFGRRRHKE